MKDTVKCYLVIDFKDAALIVANKYYKRSRYAKSSSTIINGVEYEAPNYDAPIGVSQLANALHIMCGLPPVPAKRKKESIFTHCEELVKMARNSYIHYDMNVPLRFILKKENEEPVRLCEVGDMFSSHKPFRNSHRQFKTIINGNEYNGLFNWTIFKERIQGVSKDLWDELLTLFNETLSCNNVVNDYTFANFVEEFHKHLDDPQVEKFREERYDSYRKMGSDGLHRYRIGGNHLKLIFNDFKINNKGNGLKNDNEYGGPYPILINSTPGYLKQRYRGRIIIPIYDDNVKETMKEVGIIPNILEGGLISIVGFKKSINQDDLEKNYTKITEQKMNEIFSKQIVR